MLAAAYVSKMQALLDSWEEHRSATEVPADSSVHWEEPQGLLDFMATLQEGHPAFERVEAIRNLMCKSSGASRS